MRKILETYLMILVGCINIRGTHVATNNSKTNNILFFLISELKIVYYNKY